MIYYYTPMRKAKIKKTDSIKCWRVCGATRTLIRWWQEFKMVQALWKEFVSLLKSKTHAADYPAIPCLDIDPRESKCPQKRLLHK